MNCPDREARLNDYIDGILGTSELREVEQHIATCAGCRRTIDELRELIAASCELPREIAPPRDLLPAIHAGVAGSHSTGATARATRGSWPIWMGLAASLLLVSIAGFAASRLLDRDGSPADAGVIAVSADPSAPGSVERDYLEATQLLLASIEQRRDRYSVETLVVLEKNLAIIDRAITDVRTALAADPANTGNEQVLSAMYGQKVDLLRRFSRLSS